MPRVLHVDLHRLAKATNAFVFTLPFLFFLLGYFVSFYFHFLTVAALFLLVVNFSYRHIQNEHTILRNFGILGQGRYLIESIGPELRQYLFLNDREERPFNRAERSEVYRKAKNVDSAASFGTLTEYDASEIKLRHSLFPTDPRKKRDFRLTLGEERGVDEPYTLRRPIMISAMSYGALGERAVRALARGAALAGIPMNTGEGGYPKYHLMEKADLIFQLGTAKFGARHEEGRLDEEKLRAIAALPQARMIEIKFSQGAKPGKGGLLPKEKITREIAELRNIPPGKDAVSPPRHTECHDLASTVDFISRIQRLVPVPVGIKMAVGSLHAVHEFVCAMKERNVFPDWITVDGGEGGTGAAPSGFLDRVGMPLLPSLFGVAQILVMEGVRDRLKIFAGGKLINAGRQAVAFALGADAVYTARGFMLAIGCIQARECANNTCPVGITTHDPMLQAGLDPGVKATRVDHYVRNTLHDLEQLVSAAGKCCPSELSEADLFIPSGTNLWRMIEHEPFLRSLRSGREDSAHGPPQQPITSDS